MHNENHNNNNMSNTGKDHHLSVKCGDKFKIEVESNPSTGYRWHIIFFNEDILKLISSEFVAKLTNQIGTSGIERFNFEAKKEGTTCIQMVYKRAWEDQEMKLKEYFVNVE
ncbi:MAG TPA: protease inhibitor I42 family protein [Nitrososphaeraceae archaeon]|nr:protease inhibitor I42 family protein [Nitrososphaeraceae archaeon]